MIEAILLTVVLIFFILMAVEYHIEINCKHEKWAQYHSKKCRVCIDCGRIEPMETHL
jgi:hypothetical protein